MLFNGAGDGTRTRDLLITSQLLYQLSYTGTCYNLIATIVAHVGLKPPATKVAHVGLKPPATKVAHVGLKPPATKVAHVGLKPPATKVAHVGLNFVTQNLVNGDPERTRTVDL